jgi:hypothetical protein
LKICLSLWGSRIIVFWALPIDQENIHGTLFEIYLVDAGYKFTADNPSKHPGKILVWENVVQVGQKAENTLLEFEKNEPVSSLVNQEPEENCSEEIDCFEQTLNESEAELATIGSTLTASQDWTSAIFAICVQYPCEA